MATNINFNVHNRSDETVEQAFENLAEAYVFPVNSPAGALFTIMNMLDVLGPALTGINMAAMDLPSEQEPSRQENLIIRVSSQRFDTTEKKYTECPICSDNYEDQNTVSVLNCGHVFHTKCIKEWGHYKPLCPMCKAEIPTSRQYRAV